MKRQEFCFILRRSKRRRLPLVAIGSEAGRHVRAVSLEPVDQQLASAAYFRESAERGSTSDVGERKSTSVRTMCKRAGIHQAHAGEASCSY